MERVCAPPPRARVTAEAMPLRHPQLVLLTLSLLCDSSGERGCDGAGCRQERCPHRQAASERLAGGRACGDVVGEPLSTWTNSQPSLLASTAAASACAVTARLWASTSDRYCRSRCSAFKTNGVEARGHHAIVFAQTLQHARFVPSLHLCGACWARRGRRATLTSRCLTR